MFCTLNFPAQILFHSHEPFLPIFSRGTRAQHLTLCGVCLCVCVCVVSVWCPLDGCDAPIGQRGKTAVQSQSVCTVHVHTQPWAQHRNE